MDPVCVMNNESLLTTTEHSPNHAGRHLFVRHKALLIKQRDLQFQRLDYAACLVIDDFDVFHFVEVFLRHKILCEAYSTS